MIGRIAMNKEIVRTIAGFLIALVALHLGIAIWALVFPYPDMRPLHGIQQWWASFVAYWWIIFVARWH
jgi:hypothetical protein